MTDNIQNETREYRYTQLASEFLPKSTFLSINDFMELFTKSATVKNIYFKIKNRNKKKVKLFCDFLNCPFNVMAHIQTKTNKCVVTKIDTFHLSACNKILKCKATTIRSIIWDKINVDLNTKCLISDVRA